MRYICFGPSVQQVILIHVFIKTFKIFYIYIYISESQMLLMMN